MRIAAQTGHFRHCRRHLRSLSWYTFVQSAVRENFKDECVSGWPGCSKRRKIILETLDQMLHFNFGWTAVRRQYGKPTATD